MHFLTSIVELVDIIVHLKFDEKCSVHYWCFYFMIKHWHKDACVCIQTNTLQACPNIDSQSATTNNKISTDATISVTRKISEKLVEKTSSPSLINTQSTVAANMKTGDKQNWIQTESKTNNSNNNENESEDESNLECLECLQCSQYLQCIGENIFSLRVVTLGLFFIVIFVLFIDSTIGFEINGNRNSNINNNCTNIESNWAYSNASLSVLRQMSLLCLFLGSQMFVLLLFESLKTSLDDTAYYVENIFIDCANMFVWLFITIGRIINIVYLATAGSSDKNSIISIIY